MIACRKMLIGLLVITAVSGCGIAPMKDGEHIKLEQGNGIAAVVTRSISFLDVVYIVPQGAAGKTIVLTKVVPGTNMRMFDVPAGQYCLTEYIWGGKTFIADDNTGKCFEVVAGKINYSGTFHITIYNYAGHVDQIDEWPAFNNQLAREYPALAAQYDVYIRL